MYRKYLYFQIPDYIDTLELDLQEFVRKLSQTSLFDEYLRNRIRSLGIEVLSHGFGGLLKLRRRKWRRVIQEHRVIEEHPRHRQHRIVKEVNNQDPSPKLQRRITLPAALAGGSIPKKKDGSLVAKTQNIHRRLSVQ